MKAFTIMYTVYVLQSVSKKILYKGYTQDMETRLVQHNSGMTKSTKGGIPWIIAYTESASTLNEALKREKYLKSAAGRSFLKTKLFANHQGS